MDLVSERNKQIKKLIKNNASGKSKETKTACVATSADPSLSVPPNYQHNPLKVRAIIFANIINRRTLHFTTVASYGVP